VFHIIIILVILLISIGHLKTAAAAAAARQTVAQPVSEKNPSVRGAMDSAWRQHNIRLTAA
jgi:hypothetical protein